MLRRLAALALAAALLACPARAADEAKAEPAATAVKAAASAMFKAMQAGDVAATRAAATGSEKQLAVLEAMVPAMHGFKTLETAAAAKFGAEGKKLLQGEGGSPAAAMDIDKELDGASVVITGETAVVTPASAASATKPMKFKYEAGTWKVDLASMPTEEIDTPAAQTMIKAMGALAKDTAKEIQDGKYATVDEARTALQQKMLPLILQAAAAGQNPTPAPAPVPAKEPSKDPK